jgi:hypothetical protein
MKDDGINQDYLPIEMQKYDEVGWKGALLICSVLLIAGCLWRAGTWGEDRSSK